jgi:hypothetical protein
VTARIPGWAAKTKAARWYSVVDSFHATVLRSGPYRFYFYSHEPNEPPHVHVDREDLSAKFWLQPVSLARNIGFRPRELRQVQDLVAAHQTDLIGGLECVLRQ